jgi:hypothetical protein
VERWNRFTGSFVGRMKKLAVTFQWFKSMLLTWTLRRSDLSAGKIPSASNQPPTPWHPSSGVTRISVYILCFGGNCRGPLVARKVRGQNGKGQLKWPTPNQAEPRQRGCVQTSGVGAICTFKPSSMFILVRHKFALRIECPLHAVVSAMNTLLLTPTHSYSGERRGRKREKKSGGGGGKKRRRGKRDRRGR